MLLSRMRRLVTTLTFVTSLVTLHAAPGPAPENTWPGFRGHAMSGVAPSAKIPEKWSTTENVRWKIDLPGHGWSSPIVWGDTVFVTSAIGGKPFKQPTAGLYGNDYIAELPRRDCRDDEIMRRVRARDNEIAGGVRRDPLHGLRARRGDRARSSGSGRRTRRIPRAAVIARTPTRRKRRSRMASGSTSRSVRTSVSSATRSTARCCGRSSGRRSRSTSTSAPRRRQSSQTGASTCCTTARPSRTSPRSTPDRRGDLAHRAAGYRPAEARRGPRRSCGRTRSAPRS